VLHCLRALHAQVPLDRLVTAGGCALNGVCNARILRETPFRQAYIHGAAGDDGTAVGAALQVWNGVLARPRSPYLGHAYLGPEYPAAEMRDALADAGLVGEQLEEPALLERVAGLLAEGRVVGWYQGRSEWGPRALGNRSILAHPGWPGMKDLINLKIKRREAFRPFAPSILAERVGDYFEQTVESPFMMHVVRIREERRDELAAVCHEDFTGRLHSVSAEQNPLYHDLIAAFARQTGTPVVLNTSFNENEPIVDTPAQAIACFLRSDIDVLCLGPYVVVKARGD
jgi:carbamoyltransferase